MQNLKVGLQLYSIRDKMEENMEEALQAVKAMGYDYVEFAGYFGKSAQEVRALLDQYGLTCISVHQGYGVFLEDPAENIAYLKTIGAKYCAIPWMDKEKHKGYPGFEQAVREILQVAALLQENGIQMLYHNHDFEFEKFQDKYLLDWLYETIPAALLQPEIDTCWVKYAGCDPCAYLEQYAGRIDVVHLKDFTAKRLSQGPVYALIDDSGKETKTDSKEENGFRFQPVGSGLQDWEAVLAASARAGAEYVIVEQDQWYDQDSLACAKKSRDYLKGLGV